MLQRTIIFGIFTAVIITSCAQQSRLNAFEYSSNKNITCRNGAVVSAHPLASLVGVNILKKGGNAVDAAIATQLALAVVYPGAGNIGGGGFMVAHLVRSNSPASGENLALDFRETAPQSASRNMYLNEKGEADLTLSQNGRLAVGVPGTVAGIFAAMKYAKLPFKELIQPSIELAEKGFRITEKEANSLNNYREDFLKFSSEQPAFVKATPWKNGDTLIQKELATTLKLIRDHGAAGFYEGRTAQLIVDEMKKGHGIISMDDLKNYEAKFRKPQTFEYKGATIVGMPLPSSGGLLVEQMLKMIAPWRPDTMQFGSPSAIQLMVEAERRAYADRAKFMGDPDFTKAPTDTLTSTDYLAARMEDFRPGIAGNSSITKPGDMPYESTQTTHLSVLDKDGNAVAITTTLNGGYGSRTVVAGAGFLLNNEMDDFSAKPGVPNMYGAIGGDANSIAPRKRMLSSMTPTIVLKGNKPWIVTGTPGGTTIPTSVFQTLVDIIDFDMTPAEAIKAPKFHHQWLPDDIIMEAGFSEETVRRLRDMGYKIDPTSAIGRVEIILRNPEGVIQAAADIRGEDSAAGY